MAFGFLVLAVISFVSFIVGFKSTEQRIEKAKEIGRQTGYKKLGIKVKKKDEHTWIVKKGGK